jgi:hypothetical protein
MQIDWSALQLLAGLKGTRSEIVKQKRETERKDRVSFSLLHHSITSLFDSYGGLFQLADDLLNLCKLRA